MTPVRHVVVSGVSGSGKTTFGRALAEALDLPYAEGDDLHSEANRAKMTAGHPLDDEDRWPWLDAVARWLEGHAAGGVITCSALRRVYRDRIREVVPDAFFCHLDGDPELLRSRQAARKGHFMPPSLMDSQLETLEPLERDEAGLVLDVADDLSELVERAGRELRAGRRRR